MRCPRCGAFDHDLCSVDGRAIKTQPYGTDGLICEACGCTEAAHGGEWGEGRTCDHNCTGWFYV